MRPALETACPNGGVMPHNYAGAAALEELRESGDYDKIATLLGVGWQTASEYDEETVRIRLLVAELAGRNGLVEEIEVALAPYLENIDRVPFALAARVMLMTAVFHYRRNEPSEALRLGLLSQSIAGVRDDDHTKGEAIQLQGQALWSLEKWEDAARCFESAIETYASGSRSYWLGVAYLCLGAVRNRIGAVEDARTTLE